IRYPRPTVPWAFYRAAPRALASAPSGITLPPGETREGAALCPAFFLGSHAMLKDRYGNPVSTHSQAALAHYDQALELIRTYRGDPIAALDAALAEDPQFGAAWAARAGLLVQQTDKAYAEEAGRTIRAGLAASLNDRERGHLQAAQEWNEGRFHNGTVRF